MKNNRIVIAVISIAVSVILAVFLFNQDPDFIKIISSDSEEVVLTSTQNGVKNIGISLFCGGAVYAIFYSIPNEYKKIRQKNKYR